MNAAATGPILVFFNVAGFQKQSVARRCRQTGLQAIVLLSRLVWPRLDVARADRPQPTISVAELTFFELLFSDGFCSLPFTFPRKGTQGRALQASSTC